MNQIITAGAGACRSLKESERVGLQKESNPSIPCTWGRIPRRPTRCLHWSSPSRPPWSPNRRSSTGHPRRQNPGHRPGPSTPAPGQAPAISAGSTSSERTRTAMPPYTNGRVLTSTAETDDTANCGPQAGHPNIGDGGGPTILSFTAANATTGSTGATTAVHPSFIVGTRAARRGAPLFYNSNDRLSAIAVSAASGAPQPSPAAAPPPSAVEAPSPAHIFGRVAAMDRRPGIRLGTWNPAALGLSTGI